jgi:hypothetical protein
LNSPASGPQISIEVFTLMSANTHQYFVVDWHLRITMVVPLVIVTESSIVPSRPLKGLPNGMTVSF